jgi:hypothetical protein
MGLYGDMLHNPPAPSGRGATLRIVGRCGCAPRCDGGMPSMQAGQQGTRSLAVSYTRGCVEGFRGPALL